MISIHSDGYFGNRVENDISSLNELNEYLQRRMGPVITDLMGPHQILMHHDKEPKVIRGEDDMNTGSEADNNTVDSRSSEGTSKLQSVPSSQGSSPPTPRPKVLRPLAPLPRLPA